MKFKLLYLAGAFNKLNIFQVVSVARGFLVNGGRKFMFYELKYFERYLERIMWVIIWYAITPKEIATLFLKS